MSQPTHDPELTAVERALAGLAPSAGALNRDALMFAAGRASVRRGWAWPCAATVSTLAAAVLVTVLLFRPAPEPVVRYVSVPVPTPPPETAPAPRPPAESVAQDDSPAPRSSSPRPGLDALTLRHQMERWNDAGLPNLPLAASDEKPAAPGELLDLPPDVRAEPWLRGRQAMLNPRGLP